MPAIPILNEILHGVAFQGFATCDACPRGIADFIPGYDPARLRREYEMLRGKGSVPSQRFNDQNQNVDEEQISTLTDLTPYC